MVQKFEIDQSILKVWIKVPNASKDCKNELFSFTNLLTLLLDLQTFAFNILRDRFITLSISLE